MNLSFPRLHGYGLDVFSWHIPASSIGSSPRSERPVRVGPFLTLTGHGRTEAGPYRSHRIPARQAYSAAGECAIQDRAKQFPGLAIETLHLHLLDRREISRTGIDHDSRQEHSDLKIMKVRRLPHHVLSGEVIAALL